MENTIDQYINHIYQNPSKRHQIFSEIPDDKKVAVFLHLRKHLQYQVLRSLPEDSVITLLKALDPDDATDMLQLYDSRTQSKLLKELSEEIQNQLGLLLKFDQKTAGGLMTLDYIQVESDENISDTAKKFKLHEKRTGKMPEIIVLQEGTVVGYVPGYELGFAKPNEKVKDHTKLVRTIHHGATEQEVLDQFRRHPHNKLVVVDDVNNVVGIVYSDDVIKVLKEQEGASLYGFAGVSAEEDVADSAKLKFRFRYKWLVINLATAFLAAFTVSLFKETLNKYVLLAVYMPIVAGMGGNAATQTLAVMVRGIALKQVTFKNFLRPLGAELISAFFNGIINGVLVFMIVFFLNKNFMIALVLAVAMVANLLVAAFFGTIVPLIMKGLKKDPASSATIFITTATDVLGFLVFLGLAALLLK